MRKSGAGGDRAKFGGRECGANAGGAIRDGDGVPAEEGPGKGEEERGSPGAFEIDADDGAAGDAGAGVEPDGKFVIGEVVEKEGADDDVKTGVGER